jgi:hypothetical protein
MVSSGTRIAYGGLAAVISVLIFHQGVWALLNYLNLPTLGMPRPYPLDPVPPFGVPRIVSLCFWGGLWGMAFGGAWRGPRGSFWFGGFWLGIAAVLVGFFIVAPLKGLPVAGGGQLNNWVRSLLINVTWGIGTGLILAWFLGDAVPPDEFSRR